MHRDVLLKNDVNIVVLRLVQLRDSYLNNNTGISIKSVKYFGSELGSTELLADIDLSTISIEQAEQLSKLIGYNGIKRGVKTDITVNDKNYAIRCLNYTDRPLINHSHRRKYEMICKYLNLDILILDNIIEEYWTRRNLKIFNEDCNYNSPLNPFLNHKRYLKKLLTFIAFNSIDFEKDINSGQFIKDTCDYILDFREPWNESTWNFYDSKKYIDTIWKYLCFSVRDKKGMIPDKELLLSHNKDIMKWTHLINGRYKGALHIRVKKFCSANNGNSFVAKFKKAIKIVKKNKGERDEYLIKLFLVECREKQLAIPIGDKVEIVKNVGSSKKEYGKPSLWLKWESLDAKDVVYMCNSIGANKSGSYSKADVYVNGIGISVKSRRGEPPSIINQTTREKILRVMNLLNAPIAPLDEIITNYWTLRKSNIIPEDVDNLNPRSPFKEHLNILKPLLDYFAFDGTGTKKSEEPADYILSIGLPNDVSTWSYFSKENYIISIWQKLKFSIRSKGTPQTIDLNNPAHQLMFPWIQESENKKKGALSVRVKH